MSIIAYTGLPGSGKSYGVVENVIMPALLQGRVVVTNIPLKEVVIYQYLHKQGMKHMDLRELDMEKAKGEPGYLQSFPGGAVFVMDELWQLWPSGLKASNVPEDQKSFLAEHRHKVGSDGRSQEIVLVTQDLAQVAAFVRQLVETTYRAEKLNAIGKENAYRVDIYPGAATGSNPGKRMREMYGTYKPFIFQFYSSHTKSELGTAGLEEKVDKRANILQSGMIKIGMPFAMLAIVFGVYLTYQTFVSIFDSDEVQAADVTEEPLIEDKYQPKLSIPEPKKVKSDISSSMNPYSEPVQTISGKDYSDIWRLGGYIDGFKDGEKHQMAVLIGRGRVRYIPTDSCNQIDGTPEIECDVDGLIVTFWSGQELNNPGRTRTERQI